MLAFITVYPVRFLSRYQELLELYPTAKVLLTVREPSRWQL